MSVSGRPSPDSEIRTSCLALRSRGITLSNMMLELDANLHLVSIARRHGNGGIDRVLWSPG